MTYQPGDHVLIDRDEYSHKEPAVVLSQHRSLAYFWHVRLEAEGEEITVRESQMKKEGR